MKVIYCGFGRAGLECLYQLINFQNLNPNDIVVFTHNVDENKNFIEHLDNNNIIYYTDSVNSHYKELCEFKPDILMSVYYRYKIKPEILGLVNYKAMNLHPSLLPAYRGTKSSVWALLNKESETGVSFHYITDEIDDGSIILQKKIKILDTDTAYSLYNKLISLFICNFYFALDRLLNNYPGETQKGEISYYKRELPFKGKRYFDSLDYEDAKQFVKAMYFPPFKGAIFLTKDGKESEVKSVDELVKYKSLFKG